MQIIDIRFPLEGTAQEKMSRGLEIAKDLRRVNLLEIRDLATYWHIWEMIQETADYYELGFHWVGYRAILRLVMELRRLGY